VGRHSKNDFRWKGGGGEERASALWEGIEQPGRGGRSKGMIDSNKGGLGEGVLKTLTAPLNDPVEAEKSTDQKKE